VSLNTSHGGSNSIETSLQAADKALRLQLILADGSTYAREGAFNFAIRQWMKALARFSIAALFESGQTFCAGWLCEGSSGDPLATRSLCYIPNGHCRSCKEATKLPSLAATAGGHSTVRIGEAFRGPDCDRRAECGEGVSLRRAFRRCGGNWL